MEKVPQKVPAYRIVLVIVGLLSILGGAVAVYSTAKGPWGYSDSVAYIVSARNLLKGIGLGYYSPSGRFYVLTHYPPFYPLLLAGIGLFRVDLVAATRWLSILLFVATLFGAGWVFIRYCSTPWLAFLAISLIGIFPTTLTMFSSSMSEPLFVFLFLLSGFSLVGYLRFDNYRWLVFSALATALLPLTRYIGVAIAFAAAVSILLFTPEPWKRRFKKAALFSLIACLPIILWMVWVYSSVDHSLAGRGFQTNWVSLSTRFMEFRAAFLNTVWVWLPYGKYLVSLRSRLRTMLLVLAAVVVAVITLLAERRACKRDLQAGSSGDLRIFGVFGLSSLAYVAALALSYLFTRPAPDIDDRMLLPLYAGIVMSMSAAFSGWRNAWFRNGKRWRMVIPLLMAAVFVYWYVPDSLWAVKYYHHGWGFTRYSWRNSETIQAVRDLPAGLPLVSNNAMSLLLWADRPAYDMLAKLPLDFADQSSLYGSDETDEVQVIFREQGAALVIFDSQLREQLVQGFGEKGRKRLDSLFDGLILGGQYTDGAIYFYPK
jgi:hypothetical protein